MPRVPERWSCAGLGLVLCRAPGLWGWTPGGDRQTAVEVAFAAAFPAEDPKTFLAAMIPRRARALATSMTYMARHRVGRDSNSIGPLPLPVPDDTPCVITYLHYAIDPVVQLALLEDNTHRRFRWVVYPPPPIRPLRWEDERNLYLAGGTIPLTVADTFLFVTKQNWLLEARRHLDDGGDVLLALDSPINARRPAGAQLQIGEASMPVSPAIDVLARNARLLFVWPEPRPDHTWTLHCEEFPDTTAVAAAASRWIHSYRDYWAAWSGVTSRVKATSMRGEGE